MRWLAEQFETIARWADRHSPQTLFARALIIFVVPMLLLQALSAWWFYSQRGDNVTNRLALLLVRDLRLLIELRTDFPDDAHRFWIINHARTDRLLSVRFRGRAVPAFAFKGGRREVRNAGPAFQTRKIRLRRSIQQRTEMLAGVSHDLRTPLTRMKLSLALLPESPETKELADDVADMQRMIEGYLAFARGEGDEDPVPVDLAEILEDVAAGARRDNANVEVGWRGDMAVELRALALKRCLTNLVSNPLRYRTKAPPQATRRRTSAQITLADHGPAIPPDSSED